MTTVTVSGKIHGNAATISLVDGKLKGSPYLIALVRGRINLGDPAYIGPQYPTVNPSLDDPWEFAITAAACLTSEPTFSGDLPTLPSPPQGVDI